MDRRSFVRNLGGLVLAAPTLEHLLGRSALAVQETKPKIPKRFIAICTPFGVVGHDWFPRMKNGVRSGQATVGELSSFHGMDMSSVLKQSHFDSISEKMLILDGLDANPKTNHSTAFPLTGYTTIRMEDVVVESIDQLIARRSPIYSTVPNVRSINLSNGTGTHTSNGSTMSFIREGSKTILNPEIYDPVVGARTLFEGVVAAGGDADRQEAKKRHRLNKAHHIHEQFKRALAHPRLGQADRRKFEAYMAHLDDFQNAIRAQESVVCTHPKAPDDPYETKVSRFDSNRARDHLSVMAHAIRCDLTRVYTFNMEPVHYRYPDLQVGTSNHHGMAHRWFEDGVASARTDMRNISMLHSKLVSDFIKSIDVVEDQDTGYTYLDNSVVVWLNNMGSTWNHHGSRVPCVLFGGRDFLKQGLLVDYRTDKKITHLGTSERIGRSYNNLLITLCQLFGLTPEQYEQEQKGIGNYGSPGAFAKGFGDKAAYEEYAFGDRRTSLLEILK